MSFSNDESDNVLDVFDSSKTLYNTLPVQKQMLKFVLC